MKYSVITFSILFFIVLTISSCSKKDAAEPDFDYGPFNYGAISSVQANGNIIIELKQDTSNKVIRKTTGGPQIIAAGGALILNGSGTVTIGVKDPLSVSLNTGGLKNTGPISMKQLTISEQSATIMLDSLYVEESITVMLNNTGQCQISGTTPYLSVGTTNLAQYFGFGLITDSCYVSGSSLGQIQVNTTKKLSGVNYGDGAVFYKGNPPIVNVYNYGSGKFIPN
jgi:hypothetical protein